jgi:hypothetical protein
MNFDEIPFCKILGGFKLIPFFDLLIASMLEVAEEFMEICSRKGEFKAMNVSFVGSSFVSKFPAGDYQINLQLFDSEDENIFNLTTYSSLTH